MAEKYIKDAIQKYKTGQTTEHSFRGNLQEFIERTVQGVQAINEPRRQKCGAPDYIIQKRSIPIGYIEAKDIDKNLDTVEKTEQLARYKSSLSRLILTNYLEFRFFIDGSLIDTVKIADLQNGKIRIYESEFIKLIDHIRNFCNYQGQTIKSSKQLASLMAQKAVMIRDVIINALKLEDESSLINQRNAFKQILLHDLDNNTFADMYAQTIAYGLFAARLNDKTLEDFSRQEARELISKNNPFLRQLFDYISGANLDDNLIWIVDDLVEIFRCTDLNKLLKNYGRNTQMSDPFLHFYETFLESYDKINREKRGVYYTPQPIVRFIVSAADKILKNDFNLKQGLADDSMIKYTKTLYYKQEKTKKKDKNGKPVYEIVDVPVTAEEDVYKVQILDPASGTGTFLAETIRKIYSYFENQQGIWSSYTDKALIPRLNGFEIMMTPYVMCHLKLEMLLNETGYKPLKKTNRFNVYLTNALEQDEVSNYPLFDWLSDEARHAGIIKNEKPIMVVIGNPPYSVSSCNKSKYIDNLMEAYKQDLNEKNIQPLSDDYIKFIRMGETYIEKNNEGILAYISNNSFLDGIIHRRMRQHLMNTFDKIYIIDLHGNAKKKEKCPDGSKDENVFDIQQGVSINIFVKTGKKQPDKPAKVYHKELFGLRDYKFDYLNKHELDNVDFVKLNPEPPYYFFVPKDFSLKNNYDKGFSINNLYLESACGIVTSKDDVNVQYTEEKARQLQQDFINLSEDELKSKYNIGQDTRDWSILRAKKDVSKNEQNTYICAYEYRPFDIRYIVYTGETNGLVAWPRARSFVSMLKSNISLLVCRQQSTFDFQHTFITKYLSDKCTISSQTREASYVFPLYLYDNSEKQTSFFNKNRKPNLNMDIINDIEKRLGLTFKSEKENKAGTFAPIDILDYIYGILHSNKYRTKFKEFLKIDFPRIPYPLNAEYFFKIAELGSRLRLLHLMESIEINIITSYPVSGDNEVTKYEYKDNKVYINKTQYFDNVPEQAWNFYIGGYQPAQKWLKDRKGRMLNYEEILHYQKIIAVLVKTQEFMQKIDDVIDV